MKKEVLKIQSFSSLIKGIPVIPGLIQDYLEAQEGCQGKWFTLLKDSKSEDTGHGMSYYNRLRIFSKRKNQIIYDSGFLLYRPGHPFSSDRYDLQMGNFKILKETSQNIVFGYWSGDDQIFIKKSTQKGEIITLSHFDYRSYRKALDNQRGPQDEASFQSWVGRNLPDIGGSCWHNNIYLSNEKLCVVIGKHCNRSVDATHDAFQVFIWKKGQGVAISDLYRTGARASYSKFCSNYLRGQVTLSDDGEILYTAKSEFGDARVEMSFSLEE